MSARAEVVRGTPGRRSLPLGWWGVAMMIVTEAMLFAGLLSTYFFLRAASPTWPPPGIDPPELSRISVFTIVLLASSAPLLVVERVVKQGKLGQVRFWLVVSFVLGAAFLTNQIFEYRALTFGWRDSAYASIWYTTTGLHGLHVTAGLLMSAVVQAKVWTGRVSAERHLSVRVFSMYWHFVDVVWIFVFSSLYLSAHLR